MEKIYALYSKHTCHDDTDDCAICFASSVKEAKEKFLPLYGLNGREECVKEVKFNKFGVAIIGDY